MKLLHIADLHIGKRFGEQSFSEDQAYILRQILDIVDSENPDAVLIAGDVYDRSIPSAEAVSLLDSFLTSLVSRSLSVIMISGNHDSPERLAFGARIMEKNGVYIAPAYEGAVTPIFLRDEYGEVRVYALPFVRPAGVNAVHGAEASDYTEAVALAIREMKVDEGVRNVLLTHQFIVGAERSESEEISVGGTDGVSASVLAPFDYVALGHLHAPQSVGASHIRYAGSPLKYSFSEEHHQKSVSIVELGAKGSCAIRTAPLTPLREMRTLRGSYEELMRLDYYRDTAYTRDYTRIILTDEEDVPDGAARLRTVYKGLLLLHYDNARTARLAHPDAPTDVEEKTPTELFEELYQIQNNRPMSETQRAIVNRLVKEIWSENE